MCDEEYTEAGQHQASPYNRQYVVIPPSPAKKVALGLMDIQLITQHPALSPPTYIPSSIAADSLY